MAWVKLDDQFADHPKIAEAGPLAAWLHTKALVYCGRYLTDGRIPTVVAHSLVDWSAFGVLVETSNYSANAPTNEGLALALVDVGLWEVVPGGYQIHDYLDWNPSSETVKAEREAERQRKAAARSKQGRDSSGRITSDSSPAGVPPDVRRVSARNPVGVPPVPSPSPSPSPTLSSREREAPPPPPPVRTTETPSSVQLVALKPQAAEVRAELAKAEDIWPDVDLTATAKRLADDIADPMNRARGEHVPIVREAIAYARMQKAAKPHATPETLLGIAAQKVGWILGDYRAHKREKAKDNPGKAQVDPDDAAKEIADADKQLFADRAKRDAEPKADPRAMASLVGGVLAGFKRGAA